MDLQHWKKDVIVNSFIYKKTKTNRQCEWEAGSSVFACSGSSATEVMCTPVWDQWRYFIEPFCKRQRPKTITRFSPKHCFWCAAASCWNLRWHLVFDSCRTDCTVRVTEPSWRVNNFTITGRGCVLTPSTVILVCGVIHFTNPIHTQSLQYYRICLWMYFQLCKGLMSAHVSSVRNSLNSRMRWKLRRRTCRCRWSFWSCRGNSWSSRRRTTPTRVSGQT